MSRTILVPLDGSPFAEHALPAALAIARRTGAALELVIVDRAAVPWISPELLIAFDQNHLGVDFSSLAALPTRCCARRRVG